MRNHLMLCCAALALAACGGRTGPLQIENHAQGDLVPPWTHLDEATIAARTMTAVGVGLAAWGSDARALDGWSLTYLPGPIEQDLATGTRTEGEARFDSQEILLDAWGGGGACLETTAIVHEIGHIILGGDPDHTDARWHDKAFWHQAAGNLAAGVPADDANCRRVLGLDLMAGNRGD